MRRAVAARAHGEIERVRLPVVAEQLGEPTEVEKAPCGTDPGELGEHLLDQALELGCM